MTAEKARQRGAWWVHLLVTVLLALVVAAFFGLHYLATWVLGDTWGPIAFVPMAVVACATWTWWLDPRRRRP